MADEIKSGVNAKLEIWWDAIEYKGFRLSKTKKEYMECQFSKSRIKDKRAVKFDGQEVKSESFWYLGSIIDKDGEIKENVKS